MKKLLFSCALFVVCACGATAQVAYNIGNYKAKDRKEKADKLMQIRTEEGVALAQTLYKEAEDLILQDIEARKSAENTKSNNLKLAKLYMQYAELEEKIFTPELTLASEGAPFDTLLFCNKLEKSLDAYNTSYVYNMKPDAKGKVNADPEITLHAKYGVKTKLSYYNYCGTFMNAMGRKDASADYFRKYINLPKTSAVFSEAERDSIYTAGAASYSAARTNIAYLYYEAEDWDKAIAACDEALDDTASMHDLYLIKIKAYEEKKDSANWKRTLIEATQHTGNISFLQLLVQDYIQNEKSEEAVQLANEITQKYPNDKMAWYIKGYIELDLNKNYAAARESLGKVLDIDPDHKDALFLMGTAYINDILNQVSQKKFKYIGTNRNIYAKGKGAAAEAAWKKENAIYEKELATFRSYYEKAKPYLEHLRELTPDGARRWASPLQQIYSNLGDKAKADEMDKLLDEANKAAQ